MTIEAQPAPEPAAEGHSLQAQVDEAAAFIEAERAGPDTEGDQPSGDAEVDALDAFVEDAEIEIRDPNAAPEDEREVDLEDDEPDEAEDEDTAQAEAADEGNQPEEAQSKRKARPGPKQRLQRKVQELNAEVERFRDRDFEWAKAANGLKGQRDHYKTKYEEALSRLAELGEEEPELKRRADAAELELRERDFDAKLDQEKARLRREQSIKVQRERAVDKAIETADALASKYDVDRDYLLFRWSGNPAQKMEELAQSLSTNAKVKTSAKTKKQIAKNRKAPRMPAKGRSARPTRRPKVGDSESWVEAGMADIMGWRGK